MTKLQELQKTAEAELNRINIQIAQEEIREGAAENVAKVSKLLIDLENSVTFCRLPMTTAAHIKMAYSSEFCDHSKCFHAETCSQILSLSNKGKGKGKRNPNPNYSQNKSIISEKYVTKNLISIKVDSGVYHFTGNDYKKVVSELANTLKGKASLTQIGGYRHKGQASKGHPYFKAFIGNGQAMGSPIN